MGRLKERLIRAMVRGLQDFGDVVFTDSQRDVPVDRGTLKKSGVFRRLPDGFEIAYRAPYAAPVHFGVKAHDEQVRRHYVRLHRRKIYMRTVMRKGRPTRYYRHGMVRAHYRGPFTRHVKDRPARPWLQDSLDRHMPELGQYLGRQLGREFSSH
jgi:hypothetical protein